MRRTARLTLAIAAASLAAGAGLAPAARAQEALDSSSTWVLGSFAPSCYGAAKADRSDVEALRLCNQALEHDTLTEHDRAATFINRGVIYISRGEGDPAISDFDQAMKILPDLGEAHVNRGAALMLMRRYTEAVADITKGLALNTVQPEKAYYNRGLSREMLDDLNGAYADYREAQALKPDWAVPAQQLARFTVTVVKRPTAGAGAPAAPAQAPAANTP